MTDNRAFWNSRAALGPAAGSQDLIAAELERRAVLRYVRDGQNIIEVGCGVGTLAIEMARRHSVHVWGIDYSEAMIEQAVFNRACAGPLKGDATFGCYDVTKDQDFVPLYDLAVSVRCLINLPDWATQRAAIERILSWVKPGGLYLAVECVQCGLDKINELRATVGLPAIQRPSWNRYLELNEIDELAHDLNKRQIARWVNTVNYSGHYYILSRVINAALAQRAGVGPAYDSPINKLALELPSWITGIWGQGILFVFQRSGGESVSVL